MNHIGNLIITQDNAHKYSGLHSVSGWLDVYAPLTAPLLASGGDWLDVYATLTAPLLGRVLAHGDGYTLFEFRDGTVRAGCRGPWTVKRALKHWGKRNDKRARTFTAALHKLGAK